MSWGRLKRTAAPAVSVLPRELVKVYLRVTSDAENSLIDLLIAGALATLEGASGRGLALMRQTWRMSGEAFPRDGIVVPLWPVLSIDSVTYVDPAGVTRTLEPSAYQADVDANPVRILPVVGGAFPAVRGDQGGVKVTFKAGFGEDVEAIPADLRRYLLVLIGHCYKNRETDVTAAADALPDGVRSVVDRYAVGTF